MANLGEQICADYLTHRIGCNFISTNISIPEVQGEIDVIGIHLEKRTIYVCEVAVHTGGLGYNKNGKSDDYNILLGKFHRDIAYVQKYFPDYEVIIPMIWSPVVKISGVNAKYNVYNELLKLKEQINVDFGLELILVINEIYQEYLNQLRSHSMSETSEFYSSVMRLFQIEETLKRHLVKLDKSKVKKG